MLFKVMLEAYRNNGESFFVDCNLTEYGLEEAYKRGCVILGVDVRKDVCSTFGETAILPDQLTKFLKAGFDIHLLKMHEDFFWEIYEVEDGVLDDPEAQRLYDEDAADPNVESYERVCKRLKARWIEDHIKDNIALAPLPMTEEDMVHLFFFTVKIGNPSLKDTYDFTYSIVSPPIISIGGYGFGC